MALDEIRTRRILREKADCKQSTPNFPVFLFELFVAQCILVKRSAVHSG